MRHASVPLLVVLLGCAAFGCASPRAEALGEDASAAATPAVQRGAELYGRYCTGCHAANLRATGAQGNGSALMHIQARVGMATMPSWVAEALTREDARQIVDYLDARGATRLAD
jgi:mono/diheme cytochrome c family protein